MERGQAKKILWEIQSLYPQFNKERNADIGKLWIDRLEKGDYEKTKRKLEDYSMDSPYPPALADVIVKEHVPHEQVDMTIKADRERVAAEQADPEKAAERERKLKQMEEMLERMRRDVYE